MTQLANSITDVLADNLAARRNWDEPPQLYWLMLANGNVSLELFPIPQDIFNLGHPVEILGEFAQAVEDNAAEFRRIIPPSFIGVAFFCEAWTINYKDHDEARQAARQRDTQPPPSAHPQRIEQRTLIALERSGLRFYLGQPRGGDIETEIEHARTDDPKHAGRIPAVLAQLLNAILGTDTPATRQTI
ncbi:hypothetical protein VXE65_20370 [Mycolicibacterium conceptionense]|uniref:hypothetical protein n=1 Tax=Mycolicibacterium conceptionense TaxID=451644 RepID=UPI003204E297